MRSIGNFQPGTGADPPAGEAPAVPARAGLAELPPAHPVRDNWAMIHLDRVLYCWPNLTGLAIVLLWAYLWRPFTWLDYLVLPWCVVMGFAVGLEMAGRR